MESFTLTDDHLKKINAFITQEDAKTGGHYGAIGGAYTYHFTPTSLGVVMKVENTVTHTILDITEYEHW